MADDNSFLQKLITESKKLTEANVKKCEIERILKEITLLKNFCCINSNSENSRVDKVFKVSVKVVSNGVASANIGAVQHELAIISIQNASKNFSFNPSYWQFVIDIGNGDSVYSYSLEKSLVPGKVETFCSAFTTNSNTTPVKVNIKLVFSITFQERIFVKTLSISKLLIDVLYLLSPGRNSVIHMHDSSLSSSESSSFSHLSSNSDSEDETMKLPPVTQFFFHFDSEMVKYFIDNVILKDSLSRGFGSDATKVLQSSQSLQLFYQEEEITISSRTKATGGIVSFKSSNPKLLFALKVAILRRLMCMENVKVACPDDGVSQKLYELKLRLEELERSSRESETSDISEYMDLYLELRDVSEMIQFILVKDVE